jgi:hypothetical protein
MNAAATVQEWYDSNANFCVYRTAAPKRACVSGDVTEQAAAACAQARLRATYEGLPSEAKRRLAVDVSVAGREGQVCGPRALPGQRAHIGQCMGTPVRREAESLHFSGVAGCASYFVLNNNATV